MQAALATKNQSVLHCNRATILDPDLYHTAKLAQKKTGYKKASGLFCHVLAHSLRQVRADRGMRLFCL